MTARIFRFVRERFTKLYLVSAIHACDVAACSADSRRTVLLQCSCRSGHTPVMYLVELWGKTTLGGPLTMPFSHHALLAAMPFSQRETVQVAYGRAALFHRDSVARWWPGDGSVMARWHLDADDVKQGSKFMVAR